MYRQAILTNPNVVVIGQVGRGKSTFVKTFVWRQLAFGRQAWIVDPKGEYGPLAEACAVKPLRLVPGGPDGGVRLNPLDLRGPAALRSDSQAALRQRTELVCSLASSSLGRSLAPPERTAVEMALRSSGLRSESPTLPDVVRALLDPRRPWPPKFAPTQLAWRMTAARWRWSYEGWWRAICRGCSTA